MSNREREQTLRSLVLRAVADDYEEYSMIVHEVNKFAGERNLTFSTSEISNTLVALVEEGLAAAWQLGDSAHRIQVTQSSLPDEDTAFIITEAGNRMMGYE